MKSTWFLSMALAVSATLPALWGTGLGSVEDVVDTGLSTVSERVTRGSVLVVDLRASAREWPIDRATFATTASTALKQGALAVGIEVDMEYPASPRDGDAELEHLLATNGRFVPLAFLQEVKDPLGFVYDKEGAWRGVRCEDRSAFAVRVAVAAGLSDSLVEGCFQGILRPNGHPAADVVGLDEFSAARSLDLRGKVVILGTVHPATSVRTDSGERPIALLNASVIDASLTGNWRKPDVITSAAVYGCLLLIIFALRELRGGLSMIAAGILFASLLATRTITWFPIMPALAILVLFVVRRLTAARTSRFEDDGTTRPQ